MGKISALRAAYLGGLIKRLMVKTKKHDQIRTLADAKLNTIDEYISKAIEDCDISQEEFVLTNSELKKINELKEKIRAKVSSKLEEAKAMNKAKFDRQVEERARAISNELKNLMKKQRVSLSFSKTRATPTAPPQ